jgi:hypothetical protein
MKSSPEVDDDRTGFNMNTQKLHCLIVLSDDLAKALSYKAGNAFWRGFVVEDRRTGEVEARFRFRYVDGDSWCKLGLNPDWRNWSLQKKVEHFVNSMEFVLRTAAEMMAGTTPPGEMVTRFYPPNPDDGRATVEWLIAQDLVEVTEMWRDGEKLPISKQEGRA